MSKIIAIIPAREGSKGIPHKNLYDFCGKPLIAWTIEAALSSGLFDRVVVSTDSSKIAGVAQEYGATIPVLRPKHLAEDEVSSMDAIIHMVNWLKENENYTADHVMVLQPTSPLRNVDDIKNAYALLEQHKADSVVSVASVSQHPYWMKRIDQEGRLRDFCGEQAVPANRQELPPVYILNGAIYVTTTQQLLAQKSFYTQSTRAFVMPKERSIDIDDESDLIYAASLLDKGI